MSKKENVIISARELFCKYGYKKVSMDEIAKKSGVTKRTIYTYFKVKNDLIKYFLYEEIKKMKDIVKKIEEKNLRAPEATHQIIYSLLEYRKDNEIINKLYEESKNLSTGIARECIQILNDSLLSEIKRLLEKGIKNGDIKKCDTHLGSFVIYKMYVAVLFEWNKPLNKKQVTENIMSFLKSGIFN